MTGGMDTLLRAGQFTRVPSPTHVSKSPHGGKVFTCESQWSLKIWLIIIKVRFWLFYANIFMGLRVKSWLCSIQLATQIPSLTFKKCCHVGIHVIVGTHDLELGVKLVSPNLCDLNGWDCMDWTFSDLGLGTWDPMWTASSKGWITPRGWVNSPWGQLHEISALFGLEAGLNYIL